MLEICHAQDIDKIITVYSTAGVVINIRMKNITTQLHHVLLVRPGIEKSFCHHVTHRKNIYRIPWCKQRTLHIQRWPAWRFQQSTSHLDTQRVEGLSILSVPAITHGTLCTSQYWLESCGAGDPKRIGLFYLE